MICDLVYMGRKASSLLDDGDVEEEEDCDQGSESDEQERDKEDLFHDVDFEAFGGEQASDLGPTGSFSIFIEVNHPKYQKPHQSLQQSPLEVHSSSGIASPRCLQDLRRELDGVRHP